MAYIIRSAIWNRGIIRIERSVLRTDRFTDVQRTQSVTPDRIYRIHRKFSPELKIPNCPYETRKKLVLLNSPCILEIYRTLHDADET